MHDEVKIAMDLQNVDREVARLKSEIAYLPRHIKEIEGKLAGAQTRLEADRKALVENQKERKKLDGDIAVQQQKISKYKDQTLDVKTNEQYKALQHEIGFGEQEIKKIEDRILERMEVAEGLDARVKIAEKQLAIEKADVEKEKAEATARTAVDEKRLHELLQRREELRAQIGPNTLRQYDGLMRTRRGIAVAEVRDATCQECNVRLRPQAFQEVKANDTIRTCESCARILYYVAPPAEQAADNAETQTASNPPA